MRQKLSSSSAALTRASAILHQRLRLAHQVLAIVERLLGDVVALHQRPAALHVELRVADAHLGLIELRLGLIQRALERARIDGEQEIALLHVLAVGEHDLGEIAGDAGAHLDGFDRGKAAGELIPLDDLAGDGLADGELGSGSFRGRLLGAAAETRERRSNGAAHVLKSGFDAASTQWAEHSRGCHGRRDENQDDVTRTHLRSQTPPTPRFAYPTDVNRAIRRASGQIIRRK